jgi:hypothetical protein
MKKNKGDEPIPVIVHMNMEISQGNSLCSYVKQVKLSMFFLFSSTKMENKSAEQILMRWVWLVPAGRGRWQGKSIEGEYVANTMYTCMSM